MAVWLCLGVSNWTRQRVGKWFVRRARKSISQVPSKPLRWWHVVDGGDTSERIQPSLGVRFRIAFINDERSTSRLQTTAMMAARRISEHTWDGREQAVTRRMSGGGVFLMSA